MAGPVLLAFSGGPDSVGLAVRMRQDEVVLGYVDHRLRGRRASREERARVREIAARLGLPLVRSRVTCGPSEAAARAARYEALQGMVRRHGFAALATAHTADDRAETILLNLLRGSGLRGLAAPLPRTEIAGVERFRPALGVRRSELFAEAAPYRPVDDLSNRSTAYTRVRLRRLLLPALAELWGQDPVPLLCALGDAARRLRVSLERRAKRLGRRAGRRALLAEPAATFPYLVEALRGAGPPLTARAYASLRDFLRAGRTGREHVTPGGEAWRLLGRDRVRLTRP